MMGRCSQLGPTEAKAIQVMDTKSNDRAGIFWILANNGGNGGSL
jgi:hypothetical protein